MAKASKKPPLSFSTAEGHDPGGQGGEGAGEPFLSVGEPITHVPNVDVYSTPGEFVVEVEMPGVRKEDIDISLCGNTLTVKALKYECFEDNKVNYVCMERTFGRLYRTIDIPFPVDTSRMKASYKKGVLSIKVPRIEDKRARARRVPIEGS